MRSKKNFYTITFLLFALMLFKVSAFHVYTHQNESDNTIENCSTCDIALENQDSELIFIVNYNSPSTTLGLNSIDNNFTNKAQIYDRLQQSQLCCRPPPTIG